LRLMLNTMQAPVASSLPSSAPKDHTAAAAFGQSRALAIKRIADQPTLVTLMTPISHCTLFILSLTPRLVIAAPIWDVHFKKHHGGRQKTGIRCNEKPVSSLSSVLSSPPAIVQTRDGGGGG